MPIVYIILVKYFIAVNITIFSPEDLVNIAWDSAGGWVGGKGGRWSPEDLVNIAWDSAGGRVGGGGGSSPQRALALALGTGGRVSGAESRGAG